MTGKRERKMQGDEGTKNNGSMTTVLGDISLGTAGMLVLKGVRVSGGSCFDLKNLHHKLSCRTRDVQDGTIRIRSSTSGNYCQGMALGERGTASAKRVHCFPFSCYDGKGAYKNFENRAVGKKGESRRRDGTVVETRGRDQTSQRRVLHTK